MFVHIGLGGGRVLIGSVEIDQADAAETEADEEMGEDGSARAAAVAWNAVTRNGVFTVNGQNFTAAQCAEWWA
jgi:hypothetical protein